MFALLSLYRPGTNSLREPSGRSLDLSSSYRTPLNILCSTELCTPDNRVSDFCGSGQNSFGIAFHPVLKLPSEDDAAKQTDQQHPQRWLGYATISQALIRPSLRVRIYNNPTLISVTFDGLKVLSYDWRYHCLVVRDIAE